MITTTYTIGIILIMIAIFLTIETARQLINTGDPRWALIILVIGTALLIGILFVADEPTDKDVLNGKARYNKVVTYDGDEEIVTYRIEWNDKTKH